MNKKKWNNAMEDFVQELGSLCGLELGDIDEVNLDGIDNLDDEAPADTTSIESKQLGVQNALGGITTSVDIVFCIDVTTSMAPLINTVKKQVFDLCDNLVTHMREKKNRIVNQLRVKVIAFRDYYCDGPYAMEESQFFTLPHEKNELRCFVASLEVKGGSDMPRNALEAMALAMKSNWVQVMKPNIERARNVVVIFTDAAAHPLEKAVGHAPKGYPTDMLKSYYELYEAWHPIVRPLDKKTTNDYDMDERARRLVVFAPEDAYPWCDIVEEFDYCAVCPISTVEVCSDIILNLL